MLTRNTLVLLLKYGLGLGLLSLMIALYWHVADENGVEVGLSAVLERPVDWTALLGAAILCTISVGVTFVRWYVLVRAQDLPFAPASALRLGLVGLFFNTCMPGSVGGDVIKAVAIAREQSRRTVAVATVLLDRVIGYGGLIWLATIAGAILYAAGAYQGLESSREAQAAFGGIWGTFAALAATSLVVWAAMGFFSESWSARVALRLERIPRIGMAVSELWRAVWLYRRRGRSVAIALSLSLISHCGFVLTFYCAAMVLTPADEVPLLAVHFLVVPVGATGQAMVPTPSGVGGGEFVFGYLYRWVGATFVAGALAALIQRVILWALGFVGYIVFLRLKAAQPAPATTPTRE